MTGPNKANVIDYEPLVDSYNDRLLNQLRSHGVDHAFLEMWVPDADPVASILNMVEAAEAHGTAGFSLRVRAETLSTDGLAGIIEAVGPIATVVTETAEEHGFVHVSDIGG
jgi:hypothetical protein